MSLPKHFNNFQEYFEECLTFFQDYQYLYNIPNTEILVYNVLDNINLENEEIDVLNQNFDVSEYDEEYFRAFFKKLQRLQIVYDDFEEKSLDTDTKAPLGPKKKHEIMYLAKEIKELCKNVDCDVVADFGSGLGYLDQHIFDTTNYKVLGIECSENNYVAAKKRQRKYHETSIDSVKYIKHTISENSDTNIQNHLLDKFVNVKQFCITGLHACADLTIDAINLFLKMEHAKALIIMPCCYHKMAEVESGRGCKNFPLSKSLREIFKKFIGYEFIKVPFLRLGAQPPPCGSEKIEFLVFNLMSRAVLQLYASKHNCKLNRNKRKAVKTKILNNDFASYIQDAIYGFSIVKSEPSSNNDTVENPSFDVEELMTLWREISPVMFKKAGIYVRFQNYLQPVIESFILYDKLVYLLENGVNSCKLKKVFNEKLSPRCISLIANK